MNKNGPPRLETKEAQLYGQVYRAKLWEEDAERQKSRVMWLEKGDMNTSFFHKKASTRRGRNTINKIQASDGSWIEEEDRIIEEILNFYQQLYGTQSEENLVLEDEQVSELISKTIPDDLKDFLTNIPLVEEIKDAVWSIKGGQKSRCRWVLSVFLSEWLGYNELKVL